MPRPNDSRHSDPTDLAPAPSPFAPSPFAPSPFARGPHAEGLPLDFEPELHRIDQMVREASDVEVPADLAARIIAASTPDLPAPRTLPMVASAGRSRLARTIWGNLAVAASLALVATVGWWTVNQSGLDGPSNNVAEASPDRLDAEANLASWEMTIESAVEHDAAFEMRSLGTLADDDSVCPPCFETELAGLVTDLRH